ncbi:PE family protein PE1 [Mycobacterium conspicuum]|uniref:PE family protein PE1 n=2 Tax=Mycobacterium conspicuum TaxID=44010 RepID=A0A7I7YB95_9MYCO|nr:PE family protein PE1 [Mycobacterium conspicuum]
MDMSYVTAAPEMIASAATDVANIGSALHAANAAAAAQTTDMLAAAEDEVSVAVAQLFSGHGRAFQTLGAQAAAFHAEFVRALSGNSGAYANTEAANGAGLLTQPRVNPTSGVALIIGGSGEPIPTEHFVTTNFNLFVKPLFPNVTPQALFTPEGNYALYTGVKSLTLDVSEAQGVQILNTAIQQQIAAGNFVVVKGESQSSTISSMVMPLLAAEHVPSSDVSFVLTGNPNNPNGGLFERLNGLSIPALGITFNGPTPDNLYPTTIYTQEYDGFADVPRYPIDFLSDLNSLAGIYYVHPTYESLTPTQISNAIPLTTVGPTMTDYYMIPTANLPLLDPLRAIPVVGNPLADLIQPDLRVLVNLGYGDPNYGWSTGPANVPTQFGLFPSMSDVAKVPGLLASGTHQGIAAFNHDIHVEFAAPHAPLLPSTITSHSSGGHLTNILSNPATLVTGFSPVKVADSISNAVNALSAAASDAYQILLPTADVANALLTSLPAYDLTLFAAGLQAGNLLAAIGQPIATDTYLIPLAFAFEGFAVISQLEAVIADLQKAIP